MTTQAIEKTLYLPLPKSAVWDYLTDAEKLGRWFHPADANMTEGAPYTLRSQKDGDKMCWGEVLQMRPHDFMRWSFTVGPAAGEMSTVDWTLQDAPGGTKLSLTHSGLPSAPDAFGLVLALDKGWHGFCAALREESDKALALSHPAA